MEWQGVTPYSSLPVGSHGVISRAAGVESENRHPLGDDSITGFSPELSWSHYRALMRVVNPEARQFYEQEAIASGWDIHRGAERFSLRLTPPPPHATSRRR